MKLFSFKKPFFILAALSIPVFGCAQTAFAEEKDPYIMQPDTVYELDIDHDGTTEQVSYSTWTDEVENVGSQAVFELYKDSEPVFSATDTNWSYHWELSQFTLHDKQYFLASSITDNDYTSQIILFTADGIIEELTALTRQSDENPDSLLSSWSRAGAVVDASDNTFTLNWCDAFMSTGNIIIPVTYIVEEDQVILKEGPYPLDSEQIWTSWIDFEVQVSPEDETHAFHVAPDETVRLTEFARFHDRSYFKCINEKGEEGWYADPEDYVSSQTADGSYLMGYFLETVFAG